MSSPSASLSVMIASETSWSIGKDVSTIFPSTFPPSAAFASPGPIEAATSATVTAWSNDRFEPSGNCTETIIFSLTKQKGAGLEAPRL